MIRTAVYGGTFDPIHTGHALVASAVLRSGLADEVWFMVSPRNPLKEQASASNEERLEMARMVARRMDGLIASDFEFSLPIPSYTYDTLRALSEKYPERRFRLLTGSDNWVIFNRWRNAEKIIREYGVIVYPRPDMPVSEASSPTFGTLPEDIISEQVLFPKDLPEIKISSTEIRQRIRNGENIAFLTDPDVAGFIKMRNLYKSDQK